MLHKGHAEDRISDKMFDVFLAACGAAAGAAPQVAKDLWGAFAAKPSVPHDMFGIVALLIFGGGVAAAVVSTLFWKRKSQPTLVDLKVAEIRERTNRTKHMVAPTQTDGSSLAETQ
jgi:hypothetical protein